MSGFVPIPHAAIAAVRGALAKGAVLDLYSRAHQIGYGTLLVTDRELSEDWGVSRNDAWKILEQLAEAGCLELQRAAPRTRQPSRVTVHPAVSSPRSQTVSQTVSQNSRPGTPIHEKSQPDGEPVREPPRGDDRSRALRPDQTRPEDPVVVGGRAREALVEELLELAQAEQPDQVDLPRDEAALNRAVGRGLSREQLHSLWAWSGLSQDKQARACRSSRWRRWYSLLEGGEDPAARLALAAAWDAAGRPAGKATGPPPQAARPAPAARPRFSAADLLPKPSPSPGGAK